MAILFAQCPTHRRYVAPGHVCEDCVRERRLVADPPPVVIARTIGDPSAPQELKP